MRVFARSLLQSQEAVLDLVDSTHDVLEKVWDVDCPDTHDG